MPRFAGACLTGMPGNFSKCNPLVEFMKNRRAANTSKIDPYIAYIEENILAYNAEICSFRLRFTRGLSLKRERSCVLQLDQRLEARTLVV